MNIAHPDRPEKEDRSGRILVMMKSFAVCGFSNIFTCPLKETRRRAGYRRPYRTSSSFRRRPFTLNTALCLLKEDEDLLSLKLQPSLLPSQTLNPLLLLELVNSKDERPRSVPLPRHLRRSTMSPIQDWGPLQAIRTPKYVV